MSKGSIAFKKAKIRKAAKAPRQLKRLIREQKRLAAEEKLKSEQSVPEV